MRIRTEQLAVFHAPAAASFETSLVEYIRNECRDYPVRIPSGEFTVGELSDDDLRQMVRGGIERARGYGMTWESALASFVVLMFVVAPGFDQHPLVQHVLQDKKVDPDLRLDQLLEQLDEENWDAIEQQYDVKAWQLKERKN